MSQPSVFKDLAISDSGFVFNPSTGATFTLNPTGLAIVNALREGRGVDEVVARLGERFALTPQNLREEVKDFVRALAQQGLVSEGETEAGRVER